MSVFFVKLCLISVGTEQDIRHPVRGSVHLLTDSFQIDTGIALYDQFIMDVPDDEAVPESFHCIAEDISVDRLHYVLREFRTVGFDVFPFLCGSHAFVGDGLAAELVFTNTRLHIGEQATGREFDEEHSAFVKKLDAAYFSLDPLGNSCFHGMVDIPLEGGDHRIGLTPGID